MTALAAAIIELEAQRERIGALIADLRRHARAVEASYEDQPPRPPATPHQATPARRTRTKAAPALKPVRTLGKMSQRIVVYLRTQAAPVSQATVVRGTKLSSSQVRSALRALVTSGEVIGTGHTNSRRYAAAPGACAPRPPVATGSGAGTLAGPVSEPGPRRHLGEEPAVVTVWNGTKERSGTAPTLTPPREQQRR